MTDIIAGHPEDWHKKRTEGIGGSDIAAILGMSKWSSPQDIYRLKVGIDQPKDAGSAAARGSRLEDAVCAAFEKVARVRVAPGYEFKRHPRFERGITIQANTDGKIWIDGAEGNFEAKTAAVSSASARIMATGRVPPWYITQITGYMAATGVEYSVMGMLCGPDTHDEWDAEQCAFYAVRMNFHPQLAALLEDACLQFWMCVENRTEPEWDQHPLVPRIREYMNQVSFEQLHAVPVIGPLPNAAPRCTGCGCSEVTACTVDGVPCHWGSVDPLRCSACAPAAEGAQIVRWPDTAVRMRGGPR